jgi:hypothetical protein
MYWPGTRGQQQIDDMYDYSGSITTGGTAQLLLPQSKSRSFLLIVNTSTLSMNLQFGCGLQPTAVLTSGVVTSVTVNDVGFGYQLPPDVMFLGGGNANDPVSKGATMPDWPTPPHPAQGRALMTTSAVSGLKVSSIDINDGGVGYTAAPFVFLRANRADPTGVGLPSATAGIPLAANGGNYYVNGTTCPTSAIAIFGSVTGLTYTVKWMP